MSGGPACICPGSNRPDWRRRRYWRVVRRNWRCSAFEGYRRMPSDYSVVWCTECRRQWRTKAKYVTLLEDVTEEEQVK